MEGVFLYLTMKVEEEIKEELGLMATPEDLYQRYESVIRSIRQRLYKVFEEWGLTAVIHIEIDWTTSEIVFVVSFPKDWRIFTFLVYKLRLKPYPEVPTTTDYRGEVSVLGRRLRARLTTKREEEELAI